MTDLQSFSNLAPGFSDPALNAQSTFRVLLQAMSRPGLVWKLGICPPSPREIFPSTAAVCLTLFDLDTPIWIEPGGLNSELVQYLTFHCGCPLAQKPDQAAFGLIPDGANLPEFGSFLPGRPEYPDTSATLIVQVSSFGPPWQATLSGPGIEDSVKLGASGLASGFWPAMKANHKMYPLGLDVFLVSPDSVCGLPRSTRIQEI